MVYGGKERGYAVAMATQTDGFGRYGKSNCGKTNLLAQASALATTRIAYRRCCHCPVPHLATC